MRPQFQNGLCLFWVSEQFVAALFASFILNLGSAWFVKSLVKSTKYEWAKTLYGRIAVERQKMIWTLPKFESWQIFHSNA